MRRQSRPSDYLFLVFLCFVTPPEQNLNQELLTRLRVNPFLVDAEIVEEESNCIKVWDGWMKQPKEMKTLKTVLRNAVAEISLFVFLYLRMQNPA
ncbi:hypothetical protein CGMCC3_g18106, partial [Colletotrichum fructicola]